MIRVGLTGGAGVGKSTVLAIFKQLHWDTICADQICHQIYQTDCEELNQILSSRWNLPTLLDSSGRIDRVKIAQYVFGCPTELNWLNQLLHPRIVANVQRFFEKSQSPFQMVDATLLYEAHWESFFDAIITVWSSEQIVFSRLRERGWSDSHIKTRLSSQIHPNEKLLLSDFAIINISSLNLLHEQCLFLDRRFRTINSEEKIK